MTASKCSLFRLGQRHGRRGQTSMERADPEQCDWVGRAHLPKGRLLEALGLEQQHELPEGLDWRREQEDARIA